MTDELEWTFPSVPKCEEKGLNDSGVEMFRGDTIVSLAREICQNSLDAAIRPADGTEPGPVEIEFSLFDLQASDFPAFDEFKDAMARSRDYWKENDQAVRFFDEMKPDLNAKVLHCLRISDANTTGLTGVHAPDSSSGSAWHSLVMSSGVSNKSRGITGGSFGIGTFAAFSCSRFRTVFYATKTADGKEGFQGVCRLVTFRDEQNNMTLGPVRAPSERIVWRFRFTAPGDNAWKLDELADPEKCPDDKLDAYLRKLPWYADEIAPLGPLAAIRAKIAEVKLNCKAARMSHIYRRLDPARPAYTLTGSGGGGTHVYHWREHRALTNAERAALQTFPADFIFKGTLEQVRKQIGMAVPTRGAEAIFRAILHTFAHGDYPFVHPDPALVFANGHCRTELPLEG